MSRHENAAGHGLSRFRRWGANRPLATEDASIRTAAFVYGNILVLAALIALKPEDLVGSKAIAYVVGTGVSTFLAHVIAELVGSRIRSTDQDRHHVLRLVSDSTPIASSALAPAALMTAALLGWINPTTALLLALLVTVLRLAALGWVAGHLRGEATSLRIFVAGLVLAAVCLGVAIIKWWLTH